MAAIAALRRRMGFSSRDFRWASGPTIAVMCNVTMDATYATNGVACDFVAADGGLFPTGKILNVLPIPDSTFLGYDPQWDPVNKKMKVFTSGGTELANASAALASVVLPCLVFVQGY